MKIVKVNIKDNFYKIFIGAGLINKINSYLETVVNGKQIVIITDENIAKLYLKKLNKLITKKYKVFNFIVKSGETQKNLINAENIFTYLIENKITRDATIIAFGGGVVGDLAGFVAATYMRGINLIQIPTTLLAQVDSSVGGKTGVNHALGKNLIGAFKQPKLILIDTDFVKSLPNREIICGVAEIIKYGIIEDKIIFETIEKDYSKLFDKKYNWEDLIYKSVKIKSRIVEKDEKENNLRAILNCGHTVGHAIEKSGNYKIWKHGEAILLGLVAESFIAQELKILTVNNFKKIFSLIKIFTLPKLSDKNIANSMLYDVMKIDKKAKDNKIYFSLPNGIGKTKIEVEVSKTNINSSLNFLKNNF